MLVETRCGRLFVEVRGEGAPVVLWHSLLCDGGMWSGQLSALATRHRVINIDAPGHGRSSPTTRGYTLEDCVDALFGVMDAAGVSAAALVGLSWGGMVAMRAALRRSERVRSLILLDTNANAESAEKLPRYRAMAFVARRLGAVPPLLDRLEPIFFSPRTRLERPEIVREFRERLAAMDPASIGHAVDCVEFDRRDIRRELVQVRCPTLVVCGVDDVATPIACSEEIVGAIPGSELALVPQAGHLSAWERPEVVTPLLLERLAKTEG
ncbi:MAG: alpha/beta fold hydrolase [Deltaproteobacteria bacterium]|jgi:3-oxoadipate enol-lactonase